MTLESSADPMDRRTVDGVALGLPPLDLSPVGDAPDPVATRAGMALCLSGGGYRATLFHLGAMRRLNELGILSQVDTVSSVSGGSIAAGFLAAGLKEPWPVHGAALRDWEGFEDQVRRLCRKNIRTLPLLKKLLPWNWTRGDCTVRDLIARYRREITPLRLAELSPIPRFVFCSTDMTYGVNWIFSRNEVGSYLAGYVKNLDRFSVAEAIGASSCFPPVFSPLELGCEPHDLAPGEDRDQLLRPARIRGLRLTDGGVYDNLGLEPVWKGHRFLLVSDGGGVFTAEGDAGLFWRISRYTQIQGRQVGALRKRWLVAGFNESNPENPKGDRDRGLAGTYWGIGTPTSAYGTRMPGYSSELVKEVISKIRTDLDAFSDAEAEVLINHGYLLAAAAAERWLMPFGIVPIQAPIVIPFQTRMDEAGVRRWLSKSHRRNLPFGRLH